MKTEQEIINEYNDQKAIDALHTARRTLEASLRELDSYIQRFSDAQTPFDKASVLNWTLNHLACNITPNLRLDMLANAQAEIARSSVRNVA
jgi:hypothetical protein